MHLLFENNLIGRLRNSDNARERKMIVENIFQSPCIYEDVTFSVAESMQKKTW